MRGWVGVCSSVSRALHVLAYVCVFVCTHAYGWRILSALVRMLYVTYCCTEDSASVPVFVRRN